ncbi:hypothetical protein [Salinicola sp. CPA57]|uniref:hypothetical protein n=1 Tax=Salinicola sp. CPA57 TaxID=1949080 RepID=UPI000DA1895A|nr:hypothetical protein [Salinicola sp. CPA57]
MSPFDEMTDAERDDWIDTIANQGIGEMNCKADTGADDEAISELMLDNGYDRCVRCDWWEEVAFTQPINDECVCNDCLEDGEGEE